jgi:hypothetical protein
VLFVALIAGAGYFGINGLSDDLELMTATTKRSPAASS